MVETRGGPARRDREIDARLVEHPFCVVGLRHAGRRAEQVAVEFGRDRQIVDADMDVHAFHGRAPMRLALDLNFAGTGGAHAAGFPAQQFSVRYPTSAFIASKSAA